jgi:hypothetical protein
MFVASTHFTALKECAPIRKYQFSHLCAAIERKMPIQCTASTLILGDFNFHLPEETANIEKPYQDLWITKGPNHDEGFTFDGIRNKLIGTLYPQMREEQFRLDRVVFRPKDGTKQLLQPTHIALFANLPITSKETKQLFLSDHFGLSVGFEINKK